MLITALCKQILSLGSARVIRARITGPALATKSLCPPSCESSQNRSPNGSRQGWQSAGTQLCGRPAHVCAVDWVLILIGWDPVLVVQCFQHLPRWGQSYSSSFTARPINHIDMQQHDHNQLVLGLMTTKRGRKGGNCKVQRDGTFSCGQLELYVEWRIWSQKEAPHLMVLPISAWLCFHSISWCKMCHHLLSLLLILDTYCRWKRFLKRGGRQMTKHPLINPSKYRPRRLAWSSESSPLCTSHYTNKAQALWASELCW